MSNKPDVKANEVIEVVPGDIPQILKSHDRRLRYSIKYRGHRRGLTYPLFESLPGAGKSEVGRAMAALLERIHYDVRCGNILPSDMRLPAANWEREVSTYLGNDELPFITKDGKINEDSAVMLVWDEIRDASLPVQRIAKQGTNDNCIGNLHFPINTLHVAFANGLDHGCHSERMPLSNANRTAFYSIRPDLTSFQNYLEEISVISMPVLQAFLQTNSDVVFKIEPKTWDGKSNFASFRSLEEFGLMIETDWTEEQGKPEDEEYRREFSGISRDTMAVAKLNAILGYEAAKKAQVFLQIFEAVGSIEELLRNPDTCKLPSDLPTKWVIACKLVGEATIKHIDAVMKIASRLMGKSSFIEAYIAKAVCKSKPSLVGHPSMASWMAENTLEICGR